MASKVSIQLEFLTDSNKKVRLTVPNPKQPVDNAAVDNALNVIVSKNIFTFPQGNIVKQAGASLVQSDASAVG